MFTGFSKKKCVLGLFFIALFIILTFSLSCGAVKTFDMEISKAFLSLRGPFLNSVVSLFTHLGDFAFYIILLLPLLVISKTRLSYGIPLSVSAVLGVALRGVIKNAVARPRPTLAEHLAVETSFSFPSGHAMSSLLLWGSFVITLSYYLRTGGASLGFFGKTLRPPKIYAKSKKHIALIAFAAGLFCVLMGLSRIYAGVHWPSDIIGGWLLAGAMLCFF